MLVPDGRREKSAHVRPVSRGCVASNRTVSPAAASRTALRSRSWSSEWLHQGVSQNSLPMTSAARTPANSRAVRFASMSVPSTRSKPTNWNVWSKIAWNLRRPDSMEWPRRAYSRDSRIPINTTQRALGRVPMYRCADDLKVDQQGDRRRNEGPAASQGHQNACARSVLQSRRAPSTLNTNTDMTATYMGNASHATGFVRLRKMNSSPQAVERCDSAVTVPLTG